MKPKLDSSFFITDKRNIRHEIFTVSTQQFNKYIIENKLVFVDSIVNKYGIRSYKLDDGTVLVEESGKYALYPSVNVLLDVLANYTGPYKREILFEKNPYGKRFPEIADTLILKMFREFSLHERNNERMKMLAHLDKIIINNRNEVFLNKYILSFIALIGKYNIQEFDGHWQMIQSDDRVTWNPFIEVNDQKIYFADYIQEDFLNPNINKPATEVYETVRDIIRMNI